VVLGREVRSQQPDGRQAHAALDQQLQDYRESPRGASDLDPVVRLVLGEREHMAAVREERGIALAEVDVTGVELCEVRDELGGGHALSRRETLDPCDELVVGEATQ